MKPEMCRSVNINALGIVYEANAAKLLSMRDLLKQKCCCPVEHLSLFAD